MDLNIDYICKLSRLALSAEEKKIFGDQLVKVLEHVEKLNELDTKDISPTAHVLDIFNVTRNDEVLSDASISEQVLKHAPHRDGHFFIVPPVIE